jgi:hypothetical protein
MAHESNNENILWYIDSIKPSGNKYEVKGWIAHKTSIITELHLKNKPIACNFIDRPDVRSLYPFLPSTKVGVEFFITKDDIKKPISIALRSNIPGINNIIHNIGTLEYWFIINLGFNKTTKDLVVVDNFYNEPNMIRDYAIENVKFIPSGYHKGQRSIDPFILEGTKEKFEEILGRPIYNWNHPNYANGRFQFCTAQDPIVYHVDTQNYAAMVYLTPDAPLQTGTTTYRSKITGATRFENGENGEEYEKTFKGLSNSLNFYDKSTWEEVDTVANVYNRLVMFDAKSLHAASGYFGDAIENARLFHLFFFDI